MTRRITQINAIRKEQNSLQQTNNIVFCETNNDQVIAYYKYDDNKQNETLMVVSLNDQHVVQAMVRLPYPQLGNQPIRVHDLITDATYYWENEWNFIELEPNVPFHLFKIIK